MKNTAIPFAFFLILLPLFSVQASEMELGYSSDSNNTQDSSLNLGFDITEQTQLYMGGGESVIKDSSGEITTTSYNIGLNGIGDEQFDYDLGYAYWGNTDELTTETFHISLSLYTQDWKFTIRPETQQIVLYTKDSRNQVDIDGSGFYNSIEYFGFDMVEFLYAHSSYHYDKNLTLLNTRLAELFLSNASLMLSGSFLEKKDQAEIAFNLSSSPWLPKRITLAYTQSLIAVDKSHSETLAMRLRFDLSNNVELQLEGGEIRPEFSDNLNYAMVSLRFKN